MKFIVRMTNSIRLALTVLITLGVIGPIMAQSKEGQDKFEESVFVHTDRSTYLAGEIVWFSFYNLDRNTKQLVSLSKVGYVELLASDGTPAIQEKIKLNDGRGQGSFYLPVSLNSGNYTIRAYTRWMKNQGPSSFFEAQLTILNSFVALSPESVIADNKYDIQFLPEGGNLVAGLENRVAFKALNSKGIGIDIQGYLLGPKGDTITTFNALKFGMGSFVFQPKKNEQYKALLITEEDTIVQSIPQSVASGANILVEETQDKLVVNIASTDSSGAVLLLSLLADGERYYSQSIKMDQSLKVHEIDKSSIKVGTSRVLLQNQLMSPMAERKYYKLPPSTNRLDIETDLAKESQVRNRITINTRAKAGTKASVSIYHFDSLGSGSFPDIYAHSWIVNEVNGHVESPSFYFSDHEDAQRGLDNLMLTQGWTGFQKPTKEASSPLEYEGHIISGKLTSCSDSISLRNISLYLYSPGKLPAFYSTRSDKNGNFFFVTKDFYQDPQIKVQKNSGDADCVSVTLKSPFYEGGASNNQKIMELDSSHLGALNRRSVSMQVHNTYNEKEINRYVKESLKSVIDGEKVTYKMEDYTRFPTIEEVLREYVYEVNVQRRGGQLGLKVLNSYDNRFFENNPLVLLDGLPIVNIERTKDIDPVKIDRIEIIKRNYVMGKSTFQGVIGFFTTDGDFSWFEEESDEGFNYEGMGLTRKFYQPKYSTVEETNNRKPDFRTLIHWDPELTFDSNGEVLLDFYASDITGTFIGVINAVGQDGELGNTSFTFQVNSPTAN